MFFKKKPESSIKELADALAKELNEQILYRGIVIPFILQELDGASQGSIEAQLFARESGFSPSEYKGALEKSCQKIDGVNGPQQFLMRSCMPFQDNADLMAKLRIQTVKSVIEYWGVGKNNLKKDFKAPYAAKKIVNLVDKKNDSDFGLFHDMNADLSEMISKSSNQTPETIMPYFYARRFAVAGMYMQGIVGKQDFEYVDKLQYSYTCQIGEKMTKQEQINFQEQSLAEALDLINIYSEKLISKRTTSTFIACARSAISICDCASVVLSAVYNKENSNVIISADSCLDFCIFGYLNASDDYQKTVSKLLEFDREYKIKYL